MQEETIDYFSNGVKLKGYLVYDPASEAKRPGVIVAHAWKGQDDFARQKARELASMGYVGFAADVYGDGINVQTAEEARELMLPLFLDRKLLRERIHSAFDMLKKNPLVDSASIGAIGFCFGGLTVIELLRSGAAVSGVVSFHGVLGNKMGNQHARLAPNEKIKGALLMLHGHDDPLVSQEDIAAIENEFTQANADWQLHVYGHCMHAFTNPEEHNSKEGLMFNAKANLRSWQSMCNFFDELFT